MIDVMIEPWLLVETLAELTRRGFIDAPDNLARRCAPGGVPYTPGFDPIYAWFCLRGGRLKRSRRWGWVTLPPIVSTLSRSGPKPFVHAWVHEREEFARDAFIDVYGSTWYCLARRLHLVAGERIETDFSLTRGIDLREDTIGGFVYAEGSRPVDLSFVYRVSPWTAARLAADLLFLNWGAEPAYIIHLRDGALGYLHYKTLVNAVLRACRLPSMEAVADFGASYTPAVTRLRGYLDELIFRIVNPLGEHDVGGEHLVWVYYMARLESMLHDEPLVRLERNVSALSFFRALASRFTRVVF